MEILIILLLIVLNGIFAMAEIAIVSSRKSKLRQLANEGDKNAQAALDLALSPNRFLSTVQIGITFVGIFAGAFGGERIARDLAIELKGIPQTSQYSDIIALLLVVAAITYLSLIIGELVPKRLALNSPEKVASLIARPMKVFSSVAWPLVTFLTASTDWLLKWFKIKSKHEDPLLRQQGFFQIPKGFASVQEPAISLFDFSLASETDLQKDQDLFRGMLTNVWAGGNKQEINGQAILLLDRSQLNSSWLWTQAKVKKRFESQFYGSQYGQSFFPGPGNIIPRIEVGYAGEIPICAIRSIILLKRFTEYVQMFEDISLADIRLAANKLAITRDLTQNFDNQ